MGSVAHVSLEADSLMRIPVLDFSCREEKPPPVNKCAPLLQKVFLFLEQMLGGVSFSSLTVISTTNYFPVMGAPRKRRGLYSMQGLFL